MRVLFSFTQAWIGHCALCHGTGTPSDEHSRSLRKNGIFWGHFPWKYCKVFCALVVTVKNMFWGWRLTKCGYLFPIPEFEEKSASLRKTCVLRRRLKRSSIFLHPWICPPPSLKKNPAGAVTAADGTVPKTPPVRLCYFHHLKRGRLSSCNVQSLSVCSRDLSCSFISSSSSPVTLRRCRYTSSLSAASQVKCHSLVVQP